jgi:serine/threonine protein phosphatase PrpC
LETGYSWDTGQARKLNEDSIFCCTFDMSTHQEKVSAGLFAIADGMGGHSAGEVASSLAIRTFCTEVMAGLLEELPASPLSILSNAFSKANSVVLAASTEKSLEGMGTTLTSALVIGPDMYVAHVGDSRCSIINIRELLRVTKDHSMVQKLVDAGLITPDEAMSHPRKNEITRVLGYYADTIPDLLHVKLYAGDNILLCSDGLCGVVSAGKIVESVLSAGSAEQACSDLARQANLAGGPDNISAIIVKPSNLPSWQAVINLHTSAGAV